jgi:LPXTG-site transpeptidase (sortase) family protein
MRTLLLRAIFLAAGLGLVVIGAIVAFDLLGDETGPPPLDTSLLGVDEPPTATPLPTETPLPTATAEPEPTVAPTVAPEVPIARLVIPSIRVNAQVTPRGVSADGAMEDPKGPTEVAWYTFSALPNRPGNIVMAGHVDYINYGAAVFYNIGRLKQGDEIRIDLTNGETATYQVTSVTLYKEATAPVAEIVGPTDVETVTLITCGGVFNRALREYESRTVVKAERVL